MSRPYVDAAGTVTTPVATARRAEETADLRAFLTGLARNADAHRRTSGAASRSAARCALTWLDAWAEAKALTGEMQTKQAIAERKWTLAGAALAYLKVADQATAKQRTSIGAWLAGLAHAARADFDNPGIKRNNHWYWLGLALGAVAIAQNDQQMWTEARSIYGNALADIRDDGLLPMELARGRRALHYHVFALTPLVLLAELAASRGEDFYGMWDGRLHRLVGATLAGLGDPTSFAERAGTVQESEVEAGSGWLWLYAARFPGKVGSNAPAARYAHRWLGGDVRQLPWLSSARPRS
ncbi:MAG: alginate lyase family protein [Hyphomicrobiaceae bacterium]